MRADHTSKLTSQTQCDIIVVDNTLIMVILNAQNELEQCDDEEHRRTTGSVDTIGAPTSGSVDTIGQRGNRPPLPGHHWAAWTPSGSVATIGQRGHHRAARTPSGNVATIARRSLDTIARRSLDTIGATGATEEP